MQIKITPQHFHFEEDDCVKYNNGDNYYPITVDINIDCSLGREEMITKLTNVFDEILDTLK